MRRYRHPYHSSKGRRSYFKGRRSPTRSGRPGGSTLAKSVRELRKQVTKNQKVLDELVAPVRMKAWLHSYLKKRFGEPKRELRSLGGSKRYRL